MYKIFFLAVEIHGKAELALVKQQRPTLLCLLIVISEKRKGRKVAVDSPTSYNKHAFAIIAFSDHLVAFKNENVPSKYKSYSFYCKC